MSIQLISNTTIAELYAYLQDNGGSYNDLNQLFQIHEITPDPNVTHQSTRNRDRFLDEYIKPINLCDLTETQKLIAFIEQVTDFYPDASMLNPDAQRLLKCLQIEGWQIIGNRIVLVGSGVEDLINSMFQGNPIETVQREWDRTRLSLATDPDDALTAANAMVEATYKYILHQFNQPFPANQDVQHLAHDVHRLLDISPEQQADQDFRRALGGLLNVVVGLGSLRTKIGDAHGASPDRGRPSVHHARLAVNVAGSLCTFLIESYLNKGN